MSAFLEDSFYLYTGNILRPCLPGGVYKMTDFATLLVAETPVFVLRTFAVAIVPPAATIISHMTKGLQDQQLHVRHLATFTGTDAACFGA